MLLKDTLTLLEETVKSNFGKEMPIFLDSEAFKAEYPDAPEVHETKIQFPPMPREMTVADALVYALSKVETRNATYVVMPDHILILPWERTTPARKLNEKVRGVYEKRPLNSVLAELSEKLGATIIIDTRAVDKSKTEVSATFVNDIDLAGALRVLTEMADLKVLALDGAIFVTTPAHAEVVRKEHLQRVIDTEKIRELKEKAPLKPGPGQLGMFMFREELIDPLWPYSPRISKKEVD